MLPLPLLTTLLIHSAALLPFPFAARGLRCAIAADPALRLQVRHGGAASTSRTPHPSAARAPRLPPGRPPHRPPAPHPIARSPR
jgi:hypothetical protein